MTIFFWRPRHMTYDEWPTDCARWKQRQRRWQAELAKNRIAKTKKQRISHHASFRETLEAVSGPQISGFSTEWTRSRRCPYARADVRDHLSAPVPCQVRADPAMIAGRAFTERSGRCSVPGSPVQTLPRRRPCSIPWGASCKVRCRTDELVRQADASCCPASPANCP